MNDVKEHSYLPEILLLLREHANDTDLIYKLSDYHDSDIADAFVLLSDEERKALIPAFMSHNMSGVFSYVDNLREYLKELSADQIATVGTVIPLFFHKIKVDPAVASGPLITTVNDLVAVITYYGLAWILLIQLLHIV